MAKITFIQTNGEKIVVEGTSGSLMKLARDNGVKGIEGECGGVCSCATCHCHVQEDQFHLVGAPVGMEADLLELSDSVSNTSRLSCQIQISEKLDGLVLKVVE